MRIAELIAGLGVRIAAPLSPAALPNPAISEIRVCDLTEDSRTVMPGSLFIARRGEHSDGRRFLPQAIEAGAVAVLTDDPNLTLPPPPRGQPTPALLLTDDILLASAQLAERFYGNPSSKLTLIGVTGTNGKTTTTFLIHQILNELGVRCGLMGTVVIDDGVEVAPASLTTPPALEVSRTLARMLDAGCEAAVMEVSSHALHQRRVGALAFTIGAFTNLTGDHLDYHGTMENYAAAKSVLFSMLPPNGAAIVNADDPAAGRMVAACRAPIAACSLGAAGGAATCTAQIVRQTAAYTDCVFSGPWGRSSIRLPLVGAFNVMNAAQAAMCVFAAMSSRGMSTGKPVSFDRIAAALARVSAPPGRLEPVTAPESSIAVYVDYAHTDDALRTVLSTLKHSMSGGGTAKPGLLWCVFGCGGDRDRTKRPRMGAAAAAIADRVIITSDNPRTEDPRRIIDEIVKGVPPGEHSRLTIEPDRERAIRQAVSRAAPGDCIVIAGKGHEDYQILPDASSPGGTRRIDFDDRDAARRAASARALPILPPPAPRSNEEDGDEAVATVADFVGGSMEADNP